MEAEFLINRTNALPQDQVAVKEYAGTQPTEPQAPVATVNSTEQAIPDAVTGTRALPGNVARSSVVDSSVARAASSWSGFADLLVDDSERAETTRHISGKDDDEEDGDFFEPDDEGDDEFDDDDDDDFDDLDEIDEDFDDDDDDDFDDDLDSDDEL